QQRRHPGLVGANAEAIAGHAWLGDLEQRAADPVAVADADAIVGQILDREVFAKLADDEGRLQPILPVAMRLDLIDVDGTLLTAMAGEVTLAVAIQVQPANLAAAGHRILPDSGVHDAALPFDVARKSDIHR